MNIQRNMDHYEKGETCELECEDLKLPLVDSVIHMKVNYGSKIHRLMGYALKHMKNPAVTQITWNGSEQAVTKTISCAEIMKRKIKGLHQINRVYFKRTEEYWEPKSEGLERLKVNRDHPAITILLSKTELDDTEPGYLTDSQTKKDWLTDTKMERFELHFSVNYYSKFQEDSELYQAPGSFDAFWKKSIEEEKRHGAQRQRNRARSAPSGGGSEHEPPSFRKPKGRRRGGGYKHDKDSAKQKSQPHDLPKSAT